MSNLFQVSNVKWQAIFSSFAKTASYDLHVRKSLLAGLVKMLLQLLTTLQMYKAGLPWRLWGVTLVIMQLCLQWSL